MFDLDVMRHWANIRPGDFAYIDDSYTLTFSELNSFTRKTATLLSNEGIKPGDIVSVHLPSYLEWTTSLALHGLGATVCSLAETPNIVQDVLPDWIIGLENKSNFLNAKLLVLDDAKLEAIKIEPETAVLPGYSSPSDLARLFSTSGTTGEVKYVPLTSDQLEKWANRSGKQDFFGDDPLLSLFPLTMGASYGRALNALIHGKTYVNCEFSDYRLPKILLKYSIRSLVASPSQIANLLDQVAQTGTLLTDLKMIVVTGSTPSPKLLARIRELVNCQIFDGYGSTEAGNIGLREITDGSLQGFNINPEVTLEIVGDDNLSQPAGSIGNIRYKRSGMATHYFKNERATSAMFRDGYFYPGDSGFINENGELLLSGRTNHIINLGGRKINPEAVESIANSQLGVLDSAVFPYSGTSGIDQLAIALVTNEDFDADRFNKVMAIKSPVAPSMIGLVGSIPRNSNGKIDRYQLRLPVGYDSV